MKNAGKLESFAKRLVLRACGVGAVQRRIGVIGAFHGRLVRQRVFRNLNIDLVVDVGANEGQFAREIRRYSYDGEIISFEPTSAAYAQLVRASSRDRLWNVRQLALGERNMTQVMNVAALGVFNSFLETSAYCKEHFGPGSAGAKEETVAIRRLDEVLTEIIPNLQQRRPFLKVDTQGYDLEVLKGLGDSLRFFPALQCEVSMIPLYDGSPHWTETISFLEKAGFAVAGFLPVVDDDLAMVESDCLLVRAG
jgi:FkbM family methyltransferase